MEKYSSQISPQEKLLGADQFKLESVFNIKVINRVFTVSVNMPAGEDIGGTNRFWDTKYYLTPLHPPKIEPLTDDTIVQVLESDVRRNKRNTKII